jgi:putative transposase
VRALVRHLGRENIQWGYRRIVGELRKLGAYITHNTVKKILLEDGIHPTPEKIMKKPPVPWTTFVSAHMESLIACDFFTKPIHTPTGKHFAYSLIFIHLGSRRVYCSSSTYHPDTQWVIQQARNVTMWLEDIGVEPKY